MPLVSLGYMCVDGWQHVGRNPARIPVVTKEYRHMEGGAVVPDLPLGEDGSTGGASAADGDVCHDRNAYNADALHEQAMSDRGGGAPAVSSDTVTGMRKWLEDVGLTDLGSRIGAAAAAVAASLMHDGLLRGGLNVLRQGGGATADHVDILLNTGARGGGRVTGATDSDHAPNHERRCVAFVPPRRGMTNAVLTLVLLGGRAQSS